MGTSFYIYGIILSVVAIGFFIADIANSSLYDKSLKVWFKLIFSIFSAWLIITVTSGLKMDYNWFLLVIVTCSPAIVFVGLQMIVYGFFDKH